MKNGKIRFGCQTYTWQMSFERFAGKIEHIASIVRKSGMKGLEPELCMLGGCASDPARLKALLDAQGVELGALCLVCDWRCEKESGEEREKADAAIRMLKEVFPAAVLALCQMPGKDRAELKARQRNAISCINEIGRRAAGAGIVAAFHPNSPAGSIFRVEEDYKTLLDGMDSRHLGFAPDAGHIAKGGMDPVKTIEGAIELVRHVHFKDMDASGAWVEMGRGVIDFPGIAKALKGAGYEGWIMVEDESALAERDPDAATLANGNYIEKLSL